MQVFKAFFRILYKNKASLLMYIVIYLALAVTVEIGRASCRERV